MQISFCFCKICICLKILENMQISVNMIDRLASEIFKFESVDDNDNDGRRRTDDGPLVYFTPGLQKTDFLPVQTDL